MTQECLLCRHKRALVAGIVQNSPNAQDFNLKSNNFDFCRLYLAKKRSSEFYWMQHGIFTRWYEFYSHSILSGREVKKPVAKIVQCVVFLQLQSRVLQENVSGNYWLQTLAFNGSVRHINRFRNHGSVINQFCTVWFTVKLTQTEPNHSTTAVWKSNLTCDVEDSLRGEVTIGERAKFAFVVAHILYTI